MSELQKEEIQQTETQQSEDQQKKKFDLGAENVLKTFLTILIPTLIAQLIAGTFVVFDTFFVSKGFQAGEIFIFNGIGNISMAGDAYSALGPAAVSYAMPYTFFIIGVGLMIGAGLAAIMTKAYATNDKVTLQNSMNAYIPLTLIFGISLMVLLLLFSKVFVWFGSGFQREYLDVWFNNPGMNSSWGEGWATLDATSIAETGATIDPVVATRMFHEVNGHILSQSSWYLKIQALGAIPYVYMSAGVIMLRVQGKAQYATSFSAIGLVANIILDFTFIIVLKMNVIGAAIATVIGQYATAMAYFIYFKMHADIKQTSNDWKFATEKIGEVCKSGISIMMLQVLTGLVLIIFTFSIGVANYGDMALVTNYTAVYQGYNAVFIFLNLVIIGIAQSMAPIIGYNAVKRDAVKVKKARMYGMGSSLVFSLIAWLLILIFAKQVIGVFYTVNGSSADYIASGSFAELTGGQIIFTNGMNVAQKLLRLLFLTFPIAVMINVSGTYLQAVGQDKKTSVLLFGKVFGIIPIILILAVVPQFISADWIYGATANTTDSIPGLEQQANLNIFLALPIIDIVFLFILIYFLVTTERNVISPIAKGENVNVAPVVE